MRRNWCFFGLMGHFNNMRNTLDSHLWLVDPKEKPFMRLKIRFGKNFKLEKRNYYLRGQRNSSKSCFKLPDRFCSKLESFIALFWWCQKDNERRIHWISLDKLCVSKFQGEMGFKGLKTFNLTLLTKQVWRMLHDKNRLLYKIYRAWYFPHSEFFEAKLGQILTIYAWRGIWDAMKFLMKEDGELEMANPLKSGKIPRF